MHTPCKISRKILKNVAVCSMPGFGSSCSTFAMLPLPCSCWPYDWSQECTVQSCLSLVKDGESSRGFNSGEQQLLLIPQRCRCNVFFFSVSYQNLGLLILLAWASNTWDSIELYSCCSLCMRRNISYRALWYSFKVMSLVGSNSFPVWDIPRMASYTDWNSPDAVAANMALPRMTSAPGLSVQQNGKPRTSQCSWR